MKEVCKEPCSREGGQTKFSNSRRVECRSQGAENAQVKIPKEGINRHTKGRLGMERLSMVCEGRLVDSIYRSGLNAAHNEQGGAQKRGKTITTESFSEGSERVQRRSS